MGLVEKLGSGIRLIFESCKKMHLKKPVYSEEGDFVKITFYFQYEKVIEKSDENNILELMRSKQTVKIADITKQLGISRNTATRKINNLIKQGHVIRMGQGPATAFKLMRIHKHSASD